MGRVRLFRMRLVDCVLDSCSGPNQKREDIVELDSMSSICVNEKPLLRSATNQNMEVLGNIVLHVRIGEARIRDVFGIVRKLAVSVLLRTFFIDKFV